MLASGNGSNLQAILDAIDGHRLDAEVAAVVSDRPDAFALTRAERHGVDAVALPRYAGESRPDYDRRLASVVAAAEPDVVVLAGFMRILSMAFLGVFADRVINLHPARPGELPGVDAIGRAWQQAQAGERTSTGVMVHLVPDEGVDNGPVLATVDVPIHADDSLDELTARVHAAEHAVLVDALVRFCVPRPRYELPAQPVDTPSLALGRSQRARWSAT